MRIAYRSLNLALNLALNMVLVGAAVGLTLVACSPESPKLVPKPEEKKEKVTDVGTKMTFNPKVDILFVVDDSGSMGTHQKNLSDNIKLFVGKFKNERFLDYQIGVVTSTADSWYSGAYSDGKLVGKKERFINRNTVDGLQILEENLLVGIDGDATEKFFDPVKLALTAPLVSNYNAGFYRSDAHLALIFITDTDDQSATVKGSDEFYNFLLNDLKAGDATKLLGYGVMIPSGPTTCSRDTYEPKKLEAFLKRVGGTVYDLCDPGFGTKVADIGIDLVKKVSKTLYLSRPPIPDTIEVRYGTQVLPRDVKTGWFFDPKKNALIFGDGIVWTPQPPDTEVEVNFIAAQYQ